VIGVLGLLNKFFQGYVKPSDSSSLTHAPLVTLAWTWLIVRYTVPDFDVANITVFVMTMFALIVWKTKPSIVQCCVLLALSVSHSPASWGPRSRVCVCVRSVQMGLQELAHHYFNEVTFMASYAEPTPKAALTFLLHNIWLLPFELRAAINCASAGVIASASH
jgi:hypothetical protein